MNAIELTDTIRSANDRQEVIEKLEALAKTKTCEFILEVALQGKELLRIKEGTEHGKWIALFEVGKLKMSYDKAKRYMRVATKWTKNPALHQAQSLREAIALSCDEKKPGTKPTRRWPGWYELAREGDKFTSKFMGFIAKTPADELDDDQLNTLRRKMEPLLKFLWPDKFSLQ